MYTYINAVAIPTSLNYIKNMRNNHIIRELIFAGTYLLNNYKANIKNKTFDAQDNKGFSLRVEGKYKTTQSYDKRTYKVSNLKLRTVVFYRHRR